MKCDTCKHNPIKVRGKAVMCGHFLCYLTDEKPLYEEDKQYTFRISKYHAGLASSDDYDNGDFANIHKLRKLV